MEIWAAHKETIRLLFTDVVMPGAIDGLDWARRLKADKRTSDHSHQRLCHRYRDSRQLDRQSSRFLQNPITPRSCARNAGVLDAIAPPADSDSPK